MSIGMKRGTVYLEPHQEEWERAAEETIQTLKNILGSVAVDIQHIGSTSIRTISAKPIIDIAIAVNDYELILSKRDELEKAEIVFRFDERPDQLLFVMGDFEKDTRSHHIHVVLFGSDEWNNYINFRDYLNSNTEAAKEYEAVKLRLAEQYLDYRIAYTDGKQVSPQSSSVISKSKTPMAVQKAMGVILTHSIDLFRPIQTYLQ